MAIVGYKYDPEGVDAVYYAITDDYPRAARRIRWLLVFGLMLSLVSAVQAVDLTSQAYTGSRSLSKQAKGMAADPVLRAALETQLKLARAQATSPEGSASPAPLAQLAEVDVDGTVERGVDALAMLSAFVGNLMLGFFVVLIYFPIKYFLLWRGVRKGNPESLTQIRRTARSQLWLELLRMLCLMDMNAQATVLELPNSWSWTMVNAALILWYARRSEIREFFSCYQVKPAPVGMPIPAVATQGGLTSDVFPSVSEGDLSDSPASPTEGV